MLALADHDRDKKRGGKKHAPSGPASAARDASTPNLVWQTLALRTGTFLQPKLAVGPPSDPYEQEADRLADEVTRAAAPSRIQAYGPRLQRACACGGSCSKCAGTEDEGARVQTKRVEETNGGEQAAAPPVVEEVLRAPGRRLDAGARAFMEERFGHDFGGVRVHTDARAAASASAVGALAYTSGQHIAFAAGRYAPSTPEGSQLLAHELVHTIQQGAAGRFARKTGDWPAWHQNVLNDIAKFAGPSNGKTADAKWPAMKGYLCKLSAERAASLHTRLGPSAPGLQAGTDDFAVYVKNKFPANHARLVAILAEVAQGKQPEDCKPAEEEKKKEAKKEAKKEPPPASEPEAVEEEKPKSVADEVEKKLGEVDPVAGVGDYTGVVVLLRDLPMTSVLLTLVDIRDKYRDTAHFGLLRNLFEERGVNRLLAAAIAVELQGLTAEWRRPEEFALLRELMPDLDSADQAALLKFLPEAATPAEPTLPAGGLVAPAGSPHAALPAPLLETLWRSYARRMAGLPGTRNNLDNIFWGGRPADFWKAIDELEKHKALAIIKEIYERWVGSNLTWSNLYEIQNIWKDTSMGFNFTTKNRPGISKELGAEANPYCLDKPFTGGFYHLWEGETPCWREMISGSHGLHFCLGKTNPSVHIDFTQVVETRESGGLCNYDMGEVYQHFEDLDWVP